MPPKKYNSINNDKLLFIRLLKSFTFGETM